MLRSLAPSWIICAAAPGPDNGGDLRYYGANAPSNARRIIAEPHRRSVQNAQRSEAGPSLYLGRWRAKFLQHAFAQPLRIALAAFGKIHDPVCEHFVGKVAAISKAKRYQGHFISEAHDPDRLWVEPLAI